ncbi:hypothetical protein ACFRFU_38130 [Streptomyces sp. NPDC056704]|uniref:hypothetical protein n=1 Tax=Streptomyces sp. NPDC056704 TaxID=3345917 RepID=UPI0036B0649A
MATTGRLLTCLAAAPRWSALPGIFASVLRGRAGRTAALMAPNAGFMAASVG